MQYKSTIFINIMDIMYKAICNGTQPVCSNAFDVFYAVDTMNDDFDCTDTIMNKTGP